MKYCPKCGLCLYHHEKYCPKCGTEQPTNFVEDDNNDDIVFNEDISSNTTNKTETNQNSAVNNTLLKEEKTDNTPKSRIVAGLLALFLGIFGVHKFYCGNIGMGVAYLLFCWTGIPAIISFFEFFIYLCCPTDEEFTKKYCISDN